MNLKDPKIWLDIQLCEVIYNNFRKYQKNHKIFGEQIPNFDTRYCGVLESIIESVKLKSDLLSLDIFQIAASYYVQLARSQAFMNGNKRMSLIMTDTFLFLNGYEIKVNWVDFADLTLLVSEDRTQSIDEIIKLISLFLEKSIILK